MAALAKILPRLSDEVSDFIMALVNKYEAMGVDTPISSSPMGAEAAQKLQNLYDKAPQQFYAYKPEYLEQIAVEAAENPANSAMALINPKDMRNLATALSERSFREGVPYADRIAGIRELIEQGYPLDDSARLVVEMPTSPELTPHELRMIAMNPADEAVIRERARGRALAQVQGHEGRHRSRVAEELGIPKVLVDLYDQYGSFGDSISAEMQKGMPIYGQGRPTTDKTTLESGKVVDTPRAGNTRGIFEFLSTLGALPVGYGVLKNSGALENVSDSEAL